MSKFVTAMNKPLRLAKQAIKKPIVRRLIILLVAVGIGWGLFVLGQQSGAKKQKAIDAKNQTTSRLPGSFLNRNNLNNSNLPSQSRRSIIGTIVKIDSNNVEVKDRAGKITKVKLDDKTQITGSDFKKTNASALKADQKVFITGTKNSNDSLTATRVRIQK